MKILYHIPSLHTIYAGNSIYHGYKNAFQDLGHVFKALTSDDDQEKIFEEYQPDILITSIGGYVFKYLDLKLIKKYKKKNLKVCVNTPFWKPVFSKSRVSEVGGISANLEYVKLIKSGDFGDLYFNCFEQDDPRMDGFEFSVGYGYQTVLLAADKTIREARFDSKYECDISFIGTYLPEKKEFMHKHLFPLREKYDLKIYGRDWTLFDRFQNIAMKAGQYYNIPYLKSFKKLSPTLEGERDLHYSSKIALNIHNHTIGLHDLNERTFKIPISKGFQVVDNVSSISRYFKDGYDICVARNTDEWFEKIQYYIKNPGDRINIINNSYNNVILNHTYHNRVNQILKILNEN